MPVSTWAMIRHCPNPFLAHRAALYPWRRQTYLADFEAVLDADVPGFCDFLVQNGLGPLWSQFCATQPVGSLPEVPPLLKNTVKQDHLASAAIYLLQSAALRKAVAALDGEAILYSVFKGAGLREYLYSDPALRPMDDLDILVATDQRDEALKALASCGMTLRVNPRNLSHEVALIDGHVHLDLHWRLFRPGRSRFELGDTLLQRRQGHDGLWRLDDTANLLVMLVHPAFAKHVCGPAAKLVRLVELDRLIRDGDPDWEWVLALVSKAGVRTAAWSTIHWLRAMLGTPVDEEVLRRLRPGRLHRAYLAYWIDHNLPTRLAEIPLVNQGAFTLALHDRATDALRATATLARSQFKRGKERQNMEQGLELDQMAR